MSATIVRARKKVWDGTVAFLTDNLKFLLVDINSLTQAKSITAATNATPIVVTSTAHGYSNGDFIAVYGVTGNTNANGYRKVANVTTNTYELNDPVTGANIAGNGAFGGTAFGVSLEVMEFISDITAAIVARSGNLGTKSTTRGIFTCANPTFTAATGAVSELMVVAKDTGTDSTSPLLFFLDTFSSGMPVTPNGGDITCTIAAGGVAQMF